MRRLAAAFVVGILLIVAPAQAAWLEVFLEDPDPLLTTNVVQNRTILVNATVYCREGLPVLGCSEVQGTIQYNATGEQPDTRMNTTAGEVPFFINETGAQSLKSCGENPLASDSFCNVTWVVNASGDRGSNWRVGVLFNSTDLAIEQNHTENASVSITDCSVDFTVHWEGITFGSVNPNTGPHAAPGNSGKEYNVTLNNWSCPSDLYLRSTDLENITYGMNISAGNMSFNNITNSVSGSVNMTKTYALFKRNMIENMNFTSWYWLNVPPVFAGIYNSTVYITGVRNAADPPA